jgi:hypothetical protein
MEFWSNAITSNLASSFRLHPFFESPESFMRAPLLLLLLALANTAALAQDAKLLAEAKKEGKVIIYGSMEQDIFEGVRQSFEKKAGIPVEYWRASGAAVLERVTTERRAGKAVFDVVINNAGPMEIMLADGAFASYCLHWRKTFRRISSTPNSGRVTAPALSVSSITRTSCRPTKRPRPSRIS